MLRQSDENENIVNIPLQQRQPSLLTQQLQDKNCLFPRKQLETEAMWSTRTLLSQPDSPLMIPPLQSTLHLTQLQEQEMKKLSCHSFQDDFFGQIKNEHTLALLKLLSSEQRHTLQVLV